MSIYIYEYKYDTPIEYATPEGEIRSHICTIDGGFRTLRTGNKIIDHYIANKPHVSTVSSFINYGELPLQECECDKCSGFNGCNTPVKLVVSEYRVDLYIHFHGVPVHPSININYRFLTEKLLYHMFANISKYENNRELVVSVIGKTSFYNDEKINVKFAYSRHFGVYTYIQISANNNPYPPNGPRYFFQDNNRSVIVHKLFIKKHLESYKDFIRHSVDSLLSGQPEYGNRFIPENKLVEMIQNYDPDSPRKVKRAL